MKTLNTFKYTFLAVIIYTLSSCATSKIQTTSLTDNLSNVNFTFVATEANPDGMSPIELNKNYSIIVSPDSIKANLPYYSGDNQVIGNEYKIIDYSTNKYSFLKKKTDDGTYEVYIAPIKSIDKKGVIDYTDEMFLKVYGDGTANLTVINRHRDMISFTGNIVKSN